MAQNNAQRVGANESSIAVLQVEFRNLDSKFDTSLADVRADVKEVSEKIDKYSESTLQILKEVQLINLNSYTEISNKVAGLEKWRWMMMGAGVVLGGLGYSGIESFMSP